MPRPAVPARPLSVFSARPIMSARPSPAAVRARRRFAGRGRAGVTLVEVLMSVLVMGIGVVSVATLFPLAVLRGARATQLTAGTIAKQNAEQTIRFSRTAPLTVPLPATMGGVAVEAAPGGDANRVDVTAAPTSLLGYEFGGVSSAAMLYDPDANGVPFRLRNFAVGPLISPAGNRWGVNGAGAPGGLGQPPNKFVVDPLGAATLAGLGTAATPWQYGEVNNAGVLVDQFGTALTPAAGIGGPVLRFAWPFPWEVVNAANATPPTPASRAVRAQMLESAYEIVGRSGDYGTDLDVQATVTRVGNGNAGRLTVTFAEEDAAPGSLEEFFPQAGTDDPPLGAGTGRAVLFTPDVRASSAVPLARLRGSGIDVIPDGGRTINLALPDPDFLAAAGLTGDGDTALLRVRLERPDRRYSWLLTAYQEQGRILRAHVVVYFNRALSAADEKVFRCHPLIVNGAFDSLAIFHGSAAVPPVSGGTRLLDVGSMRWVSADRALAEDLPLADAPQAIRDYANRLGVPAAANRYTRFVPDEVTRVRLLRGGGAAVFLTAPAGVVDVYPINPPEEASGD